MFAEDDLKNFVVKNRIGEQDSIKERVTLPISNKMVVGRMWDRHLTKIIFTAEMIQKISSLDVGEAGVKITS